MHRKTVMGRTTRSEVAERLRGVCAALDVELEVCGTPLTTFLPACLQQGADLVVVDGDPDTLADIPQIEHTLFDGGAPSLFLILDAQLIEGVRLPVRLKCDFVCRDASDAEYQVRLHRLLWPGEEAGSGDFLRMGSLSMNLATYQVKVAGQPLDLTYLEYALLAFLVTHPGRTYSREALLRRVWGFDYYGGSRTVDVHVRRVRAKLGPELAQHLQTIRGVGYLWSA